MCTNVALTRREKEIAFLALHLCVGVFVSLFNTFSWVESTWRSKVMQTIVGVSVTSMQQQRSRLAGIMRISGAVPAVNELKVIITADCVTAALSLGFFSPVYLPFHHSLWQQTFQMSSQKLTSPWILFHKGQLPYILQSKNLKKKSSCPHMTQMQIKEEVHTSDSNLI